jgi:hypothetical protein
MANKRTHQLHEFKYLGNLTSSDDHTNVKNKRQALLMCKFVLQTLQQINMQEFTFEMIQNIG